jgi:hypothetical protein
MKIKTTLLLLVAALFASSCTKQNNPMEHFSKNAHFEAAMSSLQIGTLVDGFDTQAVIKVIYLNQVYKDEYQTDENFYISTHITNEPYANKERGLNHPLYTLLLNGKNSKSIVELEENNLLRMEMPISEKWSRYYYVIFDKQDTNDLNITFSHKHEGTILLKYQKDALQQ